MVLTEALYTATGNPVLEAKLLHKPFFNDVFILQDVIFLGKVFAYPLEIPLFLDNTS